jgi:hypothetical protein
VLQAPLIKVELVEVVIPGEAVPVVVVEQVL